MTAIPPAPPRDRTPRIDLALAAALVRRESRERTGLFHVEGKLAVARARDGRRPLVRLFATAACAAEFPDLSAAGMIELVAEADLAGISSVKIHEGALGVYRRVADPVGALPAPGGAGPVAVLCDVSDPANVAGVLRTACALDAGVLCAGATADPFGARAARASMGSVFHARLALAEDPRRALDELTARGFRTVAAVCEGGVPPERIPRDRPVALLLGSEARGLPEALAAACAARVTLPLSGPVDSLNVAHAAAILLYLFRG